MVESYSKGKVIYFKGGEKKEGRNGERIKGFEDKKYILKVCFSDCLV